MKKILTIAILSLVGLYGMWFGYLWKIPKTRFSGSYETAETWVFKVKEADLINIIDKIKKEHVSIEPPNAGYPTSGRHDYWYNYIFYYNDTDQDVFTWVRGNEDSSFTTLAFIAVSTHIDSLTPINQIKIDRKEINRDFSYFENKAEIRKFEEKIVSLINKEIVNQNAVSTP